MGCDLMCLTPEIGGVAGCGKVRQSATKKLTRWTVPHHPAPLKGGAGVVRRGPGPRSVSAVWVWQGVAGMTETGR